MNGAGVIGEAGARPRACPPLYLLVGSALLLGGSALLGTALIDGRGEPAAVAGPLPYEERPASLPLEPPLDALAAFVPGAAAERVELVDRASGAVAATGTFLVTGDGPPVAVGWRSAAAEPVLRLDVDPAEELRLAEALRRHLSAGAVVLALPERARRLARLAGVESPLAGADDSAGLFLPEPWRDAAAAVRARERERAGLAHDPIAAARLEALVDALLAPRERAVALLHLLTEGRGGHLVLHVSDAFAVGLMRPDEFAVGLRDLPAGGAVHDSIRLVKEWIREQGHAAYATLPRGETVLRVFFLARAEDRDRLIAHLLPFDSADLGALPGLRLVFQHRGYWVWRLDPVAGSAEKA